MKTSFLLFFFHALIFAAAQDWSHTNPAVSVLPTANWIDTPDGYVTATVGPAIIRTTDFKSYETLFRVGPYLYTDNDRNTGFEWFLSYSNSTSNYILTPVPIYADSGTYFPKALISKDLKSWKQTTKVPDLATSIASNGDLTIFSIQYYTTLYATRDGKEWQKVIIPKKPTDLTYLESVQKFVGYNKQLPNQPVYASSSGLDFTQYGNFGSIIDKTQNLHTVISGPGNSIIALVGSTNAYPYHTYVQSSNDDAKTWTLLYTFTPGKYPATTIKYANNILAIPLPNEGYNIISSDGGKTWFNQTTQLAGPTLTTISDTHFISSDNYFFNVTQNMSVWSNFSRGFDFGADLTFFAPGKGEVMAWGKGRAFKSVDGIHWQNLPQSHSIGTPNPLGYQTQWIGAPYNFWLTNGGAPNSVNFLTSLDFVQWDRFTVAEHPMLSFGTGFAHHNGTWIAAITVGQFYSDGAALVYRAEHKEYSSWVGGVPALQWERVYTRTSPDTIATGQVVYGNGLWLVQMVDHFLISKDDGKTWMNATMPVVSAWPFHFAPNIWHFPNGVWIYIDMLPPGTADEPYRPGVAYSTTDPAGGSWNEIQIPGHKESVLGAAYASASQQVLLLLDDSASIYGSKDGTSWSVWKTIPEGVGYHLYFELDDGLDLLANIATQDVFIRKH